MTRIINIIIGIVIVIILAGGVYWYFFLRIPAVTVTTTSPLPSSNYVPFNRPVSTTAKPIAEKVIATTTPPAKIIPKVQLPILRILSSTPIGGYGASTTASTTVVRWVDRGRGNIYEARGDSLDMSTISNTLLPRVYQSWWNKNDTSFIGQYLDDKGEKVTTVIASILKRIVPTSTTTQISGTTYELKGKIISGNIIAIASSPKKDRILVVNNDNDHAIGYISNFDGSKQTQLFDLPFSQVTADWPEENTIAITTKAGASYSGYLYFINAKTGTITKILGDIPGLSTKVSKDATKVLYTNTASRTDRIGTLIYDIKNKKTTTVIFRTLADKCVWSPKFKEQVYCAVPSQIPDGTYPDDWYLGKSYFIDSIWVLDANTNQSHQIVNLLTQGRAIVDAFNLQLDTTDDFLFFMNKNDLSLWSLDLVTAN